MKKQSIIITTGKRKKSVARAVIRPGKGKIRVNMIDLSMVKPEMVQLRIKEPLILAGTLSAQVDIDVTVAGGGFVGQADAARTAISNALVQFSGDEKLKEKFVEYDRNLIVSDMRQREVRKPNKHGNARARTQTSYR